MEGRAGTREESEPAALGGEERVRGAGGRRPKAHEGQWIASYLSRMSLGATRRGAIEDRLGVAVSIGLCHPAGVQDDLQPLPLDDAQYAAWVAVSTAFGSLGRICMALDSEFRIKRVSQRVDDLLGTGSYETILGLEVSSLLGDELFGPTGALRKALLAGERREGWHAALQLSQGTRPVSLTVAPLEHDPYGVCAREMRYLVVIRPAEDVAIHSTGPVGYGGIIARSPAMLRILRLIENLEHSEATVLLTGESGTGKEVVARAVHTHSPRREGPFVAVNCGALPGDLLESELFGHVRGAFTGAVRDRIGRFEAADGGTLFLDEVGDVPQHLQVKLLRVLQEKSYERVGESGSRRSNARIIAATNADLKQAVGQGTFREDLYYRLRVVPIELPPVRDRRQDIEPLAHYLLDRVSSRNNRSLRFSPNALRCLLRYRWPGNVRELENALEYAVAVCRGQTIHPDDLPSEVSGGAEEPRPVAPLDDAPGARTGGNGGDGERGRIVEALEVHQWRRDAAARALGMSRTTLWRKMREFGLLF